jgi:hypothetical protein
VLISTKISKYKKQILLCYFAGRKKVEELLQQMFQSEVADDDFGPDEIDESTEIARPSRKLTLDTVS